MPRGVRIRGPPRYRYTAIARGIQNDVERDKWKLFTYQRSCFKGSALVQLSDLYVGHHTTRLVDDRQNIVRLRRTLRTQICYRLSKEFHVHVAIDRTDWVARRVWFRDDSSQGWNSDPFFNLIPLY